MAAEALQWSLSAQAAPAGPPVSADAPLLALYGLPTQVAEPVMLLAGLLGWRVAQRACGGSVAARLCMAMLPAGPGDAPPLMAWSTDNNLNEHISAAALSIMEQPLCVSRLELLLQDCCWSAPVGGRGSATHDTGACSG